MGPIEYFSFIEKNVHINNNEEKSRKKSRKKEVAIRKRG